MPFSDGDFFHWLLYDAAFAPQSGGLSICLSLCTLGLCLWDFADWTPLADPVYIVLTRWASTSSSGQNDFPDLSHPHLPFNLLLSNSASYISPHPASPTTAPSNSPTRAYHPSLPLLSWWASQEAAHAFAKRNLLSPCSYFHFNPTFTAGTKALCMQMSMGLAFFYPREK